MRAISRWYNVAVCQTSHHLLRACLRPWCRPPRPQRLHHPLYLQSLQSQCLVCSRRSTTMRAWRIHQVRPSVNTRRHSSRPMSRVCVRRLLVPRLRSRPHPLRRSGRSAMQSATQPWSVCGIRRGGWAYLPRVSKYLHHRMSYTRTSSSPRRSQCPRQSPLLCHPYPHPVVLLRRRLQSHHHPK